MTALPALPDFLTCARDAVREACALPAGARLVAAMSGGVDSTVTAALLKAAGYDVVGITLQLYDQGAARQRRGSCCAGQDIADARRFAAAWAIPHYVLDYEARFRTAVIEDFADTYLRGETPIPCIRCNQTVKFNDLADVARDLGAAALATGHYARRLAGGSRPSLHRAADEGRDQSYFLFATTRAQLDYLRFPLGGMAKPVVRAVARSLGLDVAEKPDSQDICFVPEGRYTTVIDRVRPSRGAGGQIVHVDGRVLGAHAGVAGFTIGQRRRLNVAVGEPLFVTAIDGARREVTVGPRGALARTRARLREGNWLGDEDALEIAAANGRSVLAKPRSTGRTSPARLELAEGGPWVVFDAPQEAISPGQACVLHDRDDPSRVLGGGFVAECS